MQPQLPPPGKTGLPWSTDESGEYSLSRSSVWPKVTIITPSYNQVAFLESTIRSVLLQNYPNLEYFIVDGGSSDGSMDIIRKYEPWLSFWVSEPDHGQSAAINKGFHRSSGEIIAWLNSDDQYLPGAIRSAVSHLEAAKVDLVYGSSRMVELDGKEINHYTPDREINLRSLMFLWESNYACPPQPSTFFRRSLLDRVGFLDEGLHYALDYDLWLRMIQHSPFYFVNELWSNYLVHPQSKTGKGWQKFAEESYRAGLRHWHALGRKDGLTYRLLARRMIYSRHYMDDAFDAYRSQDWEKVRQALIASLRHNPSWFFNRGVLSLIRQLLFRS